MSRNRHDGARAVAHHYIVRDIDGNLLAVNGIYTGQTFYPDAGLLFYKLCAFKLSLLRALLPVGLNGIHIGDSVGILVYHRMLRRHYHEGYAVECIRTGRVDTQFLVI